MRLHFRVGLIIALAATLGVCAHAQVPSPIYPDPWAVPPILTWTVAGTTATSTNCLPTPADPLWHIVAKADINADGVADLVWVHTMTRQVAVWYLYLTPSNCIGLLTGSIIEGAALPAPWPWQRWHLQVITAPIVQFVWSAE